MIKKLVGYITLCLLATVSLHTTAYATENTQNEMTENVATTDEQTSSGNAGTITECVISGNNEIRVVAEIPTSIESDDPYYYLFEMKPYENEIGSRTDYCGLTGKTSTVLFKTVLNNKQADSKLYSKFIVAVKQGETYIPVTQEYYITNPEAVATYHPKNPLTTSIKGITADNATILELPEIGVQHASYEMGVNRFFAPSGTGYVTYTYGEKTYQFNKDVVTLYDNVLSIFASQGVEVTMNLVNYYSESTIFTIKPTGRVEGYTHYAYNTDEQYGVESLEALISFLAERYSGKNHGLISNWIIGNEVNNNNPWYFAGNYNASDFTLEYEKAYRMFYNGIKAQNANARVLTCIDQRWTWEDGTANQYGAKKFIDLYTADMKKHGDLDWGLAWHPHPVPLTAPKFWDMPASYKSMNLVSNSINTRMISPMNMDVLTNYMTQADRRSPSGQVRYIAVSEILFNSSSQSVEANEDLQAASFAYAYKMAENNPYIKAFIVHRMIDSPQEQAGDDISCGLYNCDASGMPTTKKKIYDVFKYIDTDQSDSYTKFALPMIGISSWSQVIK